MIRLDATNRKLQAVLAGAITTSQLPCTVSYSDKTSTDYVGATQLTNTNSTTAVDICAAPAASTVRDIDYVSIKNVDTASATVSVIYDDNTTDYTIAKFALAVGDQLTYTHGTGWQVIASDGTLKTGAGLADGDKGDITVSSGTWTIDAGAVTLAKMANLAQDQFIGRTTASTGVPETATITAAARTVLDDATVGAMATTLGLGTSDSPQFAGINLGHASDTTLTRVSAGVVAVEGVNVVLAGAVTTDGITMSTARLLGRTTASTGAVEEITVGSGLSLSAGSLTATGGGTGDVVGPASATANSLARFDGTTGKLLKDGAVIGTDVASLAANTFTGIQRWAKGADVASANALTLGTDGNYFDITGTTAITSIGTLGVGTVVKLHFDDALTLTHHATDLILPGATNITTAAGTEIELVEYATGDWRMVGGVKADGTAWVSDNYSAASQAEMEAGTETALRSMSPLRVAQAIAALAGGGSLLAMTTFTANGTWYKSTNNPSKIIVMAVGGGGAGSGAGVSASGGDGGCAGAVNWAYTNSPAASYEVTIGAGGTGVSDFRGNDGSASSFGALVTASGGRGGAIDSGSIKSSAGQSCLDAGGAGRTTVGNGNAAPANSGAGGGSAFDPTSSSRVGGNGGSGKIIVWEFA